MKNSSEEIRTRLRRLIKSTGLSQKDFATLSGVTPVTVNRVLSGKQDISEKYLNKLADILNVSKEYILCKTDSFHNTDNSSISKNEGNMSFFKINYSEYHIDLIYKVMKSYGFEILEGIVFGTNELDNIKAPLSGIDYIYLKVEKNAYVKIPNTLPEISKIKFPKKYLYEIDNFLEKITEKELLLEIERYHKPVSQQTLIIYNTHAQIEYTNIFKAKLLAFYKRLECDILNLFNLSNFDTSCDYENELLLSINQHNFNLEHGILL